MNEAGIDRIVRRLLELRGGEATAAASLAWNLSFPEDPETDDGPLLSCWVKVDLQDGKLAGFASDAPLDRYTEDQCLAVARLTSLLARAVAREAIQFSSFADVTAYLVTELGAEVQADWVQIPPEHEDGEPVIVSPVGVVGEPWVNLSLAFDDEVNPEWLLERNGRMAHVHFEMSEGSLSLATAFPLALLTGQRLLEIAADLSMFREQYLAEIEEEGDEEAEEDAE